MLGISDCRMFSFPIFEKYSYERHDPILKSTAARDASQRFKVSKFQNSKFRKFKVSEFKVPKFQDMWGTQFKTKTMFAIHKFPKNNNSHDLELFLDYLERLVVSEDKNKWCWGSGTRPKIPKS